MRAIILAAGEGKRLRPYTEDLPKGMLKFDGKALIERQISLFQDNGIYDICIVTGHLADRIKYSNIRYFHNPNYEQTNMVESLFCARTVLFGEIVISYADIVFEKRVLRRVLESKADVGVTVDTSWKEYWLMRHEDANIDIESLKLHKKGGIIEIGKLEKSAENIDGRYVGLLKFSPRGIKKLVSVYDKAKSIFGNKSWQTSGSFQKAYMTDLLQALIDDGQEINAIKIQHGWLEVDTARDYEQVIRLKRENMLKKFFNPEA